MVRLIIDTDPGVDDAHSIMMAHAHPDVTIEAIMTVAGNVGVEHTTPNAAKILDAIGCDAPIYQGCSAPLVYDAPERAAYVHGHDGLGDSNIPASSRQIESEHAAVALVRMANESPGEYTLAAIGPLTNIALALRLDPDLPSKIKRFVLMGGAIRSNGNTTTVSAEFNMYADPDAAYVVFENWPGLYMLDWEITLDYMAGAETIDRWWAMTNPKARFFQAITQHVIDWVMEFRGAKSFFAPDGLAVASAIQPDIVTEVQSRYVTMETRGMHTRGQTTVDWNDRLGKEPNVHIIMGVDHERFFEMLERGFAD